MPRLPRSLLAVLCGTVVVLGLGVRGAYADDDLDLLLASPSFAGLDRLFDAMRQPFWGYELSYWRPLTSAAMCVGHELGGGHPWPTHLLALAAHLLSVVLVFAIVRRLGASQAAAVATAALFAWHPCQVESVAWVAALGDPLCGAATLLAVSGWLRWRERGGLPWLAWLGTALALGAKESGVLVVAWLAVAELTLRDGKPRRVVAAGSGVALLLAAWLLARVAVFGDWRAGFDRGQLEVGFSGSDGAALRLWLGASFAALPSGWLDVTPYRAVPATGAALWASLPWRALAPLALALLWWRGRRTHRALADFCALGFVAALAPAVLLPASLGPWPLVDRYLYVALFAAGGLLLGVGAARPRLVWVLLVVLAARSALSVPHWRDHDAVVARALQDCPQHPEPHFMAGNQARLSAEAATSFRARQQHSAAAVAAYARARQRLRRPVYAHAHLDRVLGLNLELGTALAQLQGELRPSRAVADDLAALAQRYPDAAQVELARGIAAVTAGEVAAAEAAWLRALQLAPHDDQAAFNLGRLYLQSGRRDEARARFEQALRLRPGNAAAAAYLAQLGR